MLSEKLQPFLSLEHECEPANHVLIVPHPDGAVAVGVFSDEFKPPTVYLLEQVTENNGSLCWKLPVRKFSPAYNFQEWILVYVFPTRFESFRFTASNKSGPIVTSRGCFSHEPRMIAALVTSVIDELHKTKRQTREALVQKKGPDALSDTKETIKKLRKKLMKAYGLIAISIFCITLLIIKFVLVVW